MAQRAADLGREVVRPWHWTAVNEFEHWAWEAYGYALDQWLTALPEAHDVHDMGEFDRGMAFFAAHPDGWDEHPDTPLGLYGPGIQNLRVEMRCT